MSSTGIVTASGPGVAVIAISAGSASDTATVLVKQTGPNTVAISDSNVLATSDTQLILKAGAEASALHVGQILVSGDVAGILAQITALSVNGDQVVVSTTPATLAQAFPNTAADVRGASQHAVLTLSHGTGTVRFTNGRLPTLSISDATCSTEAGVTGSLSLTNSTVTVNVNVVPFFSFITSNGTVASFKLGASITATVQGATGDLIATSGGTVTFTCAVPSYAIPVPVVAFGPLILNFIASNQYGVKGTLAAAVGDTMSGPAVSAGFSGDEGIAYSAGSWTQVDTGANTGAFSLSAADPAMKIVGSLQGSFGPYDTASIGLGFALGSRFVTLLNVQMLSATAAATLDVGITSTYAAGVADYVAPSWDGKLGIDVSFDPKFSGALPQLVKKIIGIGIDFGSFSLYSSALTIAGSPQIDETVTPVQNMPCTAQLVANITDHNVFKQNYAGDQVQFVSISGPNSPSVIVTGTATGDSTRSFVTAPSPTMSPGMYSIVARLYDGVFGRLDLPYTSTPQQITLSGCPSPTPTPTSTPSPSPSPVGTPMITEFPINTGSASTPYNIVKGPDGALWFTEGNGNKIGRITVNGALTKYAVPTAGSEPVGITVGSDGALWFTEELADKIGRITTSGSITEYALPNAGKPTAANPNYIVSGPDGALWFTEFSGNKIGRITTAGALTEYALPSPSSGPTDITPGPDGALWFAEGADRIGRITTSGSITEFAAPAGSVPSSIVTGADGALWFTEDGSNRIGRITTTGVTTEYAVPSPATGNSGIRLVHIVAGPDGALWFTEFSANQIGRITTSGGFTEYKVPTMDSGLHGNTVGPDGAIWFTESQADKIGRIK